MIMVCILKMVAKEIQGIMTHFHYLGCSFKIEEIFPIILIKINKKINILIQEVIIHLALINNILLIMKNNNKKVVKIDFLMNKINRDKIVIIILVINNKIIKVKMNIAIIIL